LSIPGTTPGGDDPLLKVQITWAEQIYALARERMQTTQAAALMGVRNLLLINSGAIVALFTVLGHLDTLTVQTARLYWAFALFVAGALVAMLATLLTFRSQNDFWTVEQQTADRVFQELSARYGGSAAPTTPLPTAVVAAWTRPASIACAVLSLVFFALGSGMALAGIQLAKATPPLSQSSALSPPPSSASTRSVR